MIKEIKKYCKKIFNVEPKNLGIYLIRFNKNKGIVKCNHIEKENTIQLLTSIEDISSKKVIIKTIGTSGTIKSLIKKHMS